MRLIAFAALVCLLLAIPTFAADPQQPDTPLSAGTLNSKLMFPSLDSSSLPTKDRTVYCLSLRTYRVRKDIDRKSVIPATPDEANFDPDSIVSYSTCQRAEKFDLHKTH
jgi:hypothetical protein